LVIFLRFGSLASDSEPNLTPSQVFKRTGIKHGSQFNIVKRWKERGFKIESRMNRRGRKKMLSEEQQLWITSPSLLQE
jgi:transposase